MRDRKFQLKDNQKKNLIKISISMILGIFVLFVGLLIGFYFTLHIVGNPYLDKLDLVLDPLTYNALLDEFGYYEPLVIRFREFLFNFFKGEWGYSYIIAPGMSVIDVFVKSIPRTIKYITIPLILGIPIGIFLGKTSIRNRNNWKGAVIRTFTIIGLTTPIFFISLLLPLIQKFDSISPDLLDVYKFIIPVFSLSLLIIALVIKQTQIKMKNKLTTNSILSNSFMTGKMFGIVFAFIVMTDMFFYIKGFGYFFYNSIFMGDLFVIIGFLFMLTIIFTLTLIISNLTPIVYELIRPKLLILREKVIKKKKVVLKSNPKESNNPVRNKSEIRPKIDVKNFFIKILKSPFTLIGLSLILFFFFISIIPQLMTSYNLKEITRPYIPPMGVPFEMPSSEHPLGTTKYGYDLFALLIWGTREAFIIGFGIILIGLIGGAILGFFSAKLSRLGHNAIIGFMTFFFIIPGFFLVSLSIILFGVDIWNIMFMIGFLFIPVFTQIISNAILRDRDIIKIIKTIIVSIPLEAAFTILIYQFLGIMGLTDETTGQLGTTFNYGRGSFPTWRAWFFPGLFIFLIILSLILLHEGLITLFKDRNLSNELIIPS